MEKVFTLKRKSGWKFNLEDGMKVHTFTLPALNSLSFDEAKEMQEIGKLGDNVTEQGPKIKKFILAHAPELENYGLGDMEYYEIFNQYGLSQGGEKLGE